MEENKYLLDPKTHHYIILAADPVAIGIRARRNSATARDVQSLLVRVNVSPGVVLKHL